MKKHHDLLEESCHEIDLLIAKEIAEKEVGQTSDTLFEVYTNQLRCVLKMTEARDSLKKEYMYELRSDDLEKKKKKALLKHIHKQVTEYEESINKMLKETTLDKLSGPVTSNLDSVLQKHNIKVQAFHSRSFTGNHCHKYLRSNVLEDITDSVVSKTSSLTQNQNIVLMAETVAYNCKKLNMKYQQVHHAVSHCAHIPEDHMETIQMMIDAYVLEYRQQYPGRFFPKLHILQCHVIPFMINFPFGLALLGEQFIESSHKMFNGLKRTFGGIPLPIQRLHSMMKHHLLSIHPAISQHVPQARKRKNEDEK